MTADWPPMESCTHIAESQAGFAGSPEALSSICCSVYSFTHIPASSAGLCVEGTKVPPLPSRGMLEKQVAGRGNAELIFKKLLLKSYEPIGAGGCQSFPVGWVLCKMHGPSSVPMAFPVYDQYRLNAKCLRASSANTHSPW